MERPHKRRKYDDEEQKRREKYDDDEHKHRETYQKRRSRNDRVSDYDSPDEHKNRDTKISQRRRNRDDRGSDYDSPDEHKHKTTRETKHGRRSSYRKDDGSDYDSSDEHRNRDIKKSHRRRSSYKNDRGSDYDSPDEHKHSGTKVSRRRKSGYGNNCGSDSDSYDRRKDSSRSSKNHYEKSSNESGSKYNHDRGDGEKKEDRGKSESEEDVNSEEEMMFDWFDYKRDLNILFFQDRDLIKKGMEQYEDFLKFLKKYQALQKQKNVKKMITSLSDKKEQKKESPNQESSSVFDFPAVFDKRYLINFAFKGDSIDDLIRIRLPPIDRYDKHSKKRLSRSKVSLVTMFYLRFCPDIKINLTLNPLWIFITFTLLFSV